MWMSQHGHHSPYIFHKSIRNWRWHLSMRRKRRARLGTLYVRHLPMGWGWCMVIHNEKVCLGVDYQRALERCWRGGRLNHVHTCSASHHIAETNIVILKPFFDARIIQDTIAITSSCPCGYMAGALGSIIEHLSLHQFSQRTFLFTRSSEGWRLAFFNWACIKSNRMCLAGIDSVTWQGYKWTGFLLVTHMHQIK